MKHACVVQLCTYVSVKMLKLVIQTYNNNANKMLDFGLLPHLWWKERRNGCERS